MTTTIALYSEKNAADLLGLERDRLRQVRLKQLRLEDPSETAKNDHGETCYTPAGMAKLIEYVELNEASVGAIPTELANFALSSSWPPDEKNGAAGPVLASAPADLEQLIVTKIFPNHKLMQATRPNGDSVRVWVRTNRKFMPKMTVEARPRGEDGLEQGFWEQVGRMPRRRGRW